MLPVTREHHPVVEAEVIWLVYSAVDYKLEVSDPRPDGFPLKLFLPKESLYKSYREDEQMANIKDNPAIPTIIILSKSSTTTKHFS